MCKYKYITSAISILLVCCIILALIPGCGSSIPMGTGSLRGQCMGAGSERYPISAASNVLVIYQKTGAWTLTGADGSFTLLNIPAGNGTLVFQRTGFMTTYCEVDVQADTTSTLSSKVYLETDPQAGKKAWTVFLYMAADNSLSDDCEDNLNELEELGSTEDVNIVAFVDRTGENSKFYYIQKDNDPTTVTSPYYDYGNNLNSGDIAVFQDVSTRVMSDYPANRFMLELWDHGSGIERNGSNIGTADNKPKGICVDDASKSHLTEVELAPVLAELKSMHGKNLDILACDACLMATIEVAYEWKDCCDYFVASENSVPDAGFPYEIAYKPVIDNPSLATIDFAKAIVTAYGNYYTANGKGYETLSVINMSKVGELNTLLDAYSKALVANGDASEIWTKAYRKSIFFGQMDMRDLYSFAVLEKKIDTGYASTEAQALIDAISPTGDSKVIVSTYSGVLFQEFFKMSPGGISMWGLYTGPIPEDSPYRQCAFFSNNAWPDFIDFVNLNH